MNPKLTSDGKAILLRAMNGESIKFTKIQFGNGSAEESMGNPLLTANLTKITVGDEYATLTATFTNEEVTSGFHATEIGIFAQDPSDASNEMLYALGNEAESAADYIPDRQSRILEMQIDVIVYVGEAQNVSAAISSSLVYTSKADFDAHTSNTNNPHGVTKEQIGLGSVPNVSTNDQTPTFADTSTLAPVQSGEKLGTMFAKIKLAIQNLISHIGNKSNPHNVTARQTGAAPLTHSHNASSINTGILPLIRGGTGVGSAADLAGLLCENNVAIGTYVGNGEAPRAIATPFAPRIIYVADFTDFLTATVAQGLCFAVNDNADRKCVQMPITGQLRPDIWTALPGEHRFWVYGTTYKDRVCFNVPNRKYYYIAIR